MEGAPAETLVYWGLLIKHVLSSIPIHILASLPISKGSLDQIERIMANQCLWREDAISLEDLNELIDREMKFKFLLISQSL